MWQGVRRRDIWTVLGLLVVMGVYLYGTFQYTDRSQPPNARTFPYVLMVLLGILIVVLLWTSRNSRDSAHTTEADLDTEDDDPLLEEDPSLTRLGILALMLLAYLIVMPGVGFLFSTIALGVAMQIIIFRGPRILSLVVAIALAAGAHWLFAGFLSIPLP